MRPDEFMKKHGFDKEEEEREHSLRENAFEHAEHLRPPKAGTPHDWEDWERFKQEHPDEVEDPDAESGSESGFESGTKSGSERGPDGEQDNADR